VTPRLKSALAIACFVLIAGVALLFVGRVWHGRAHAIDAVPADAFFVMTLDVASLKKSPLGAPVVGGATSKLVGERTLRDVCGFDPLERMSELAVAVPEDGEPGDFGVAVVADLSRQELVDCAKQVLEARRPGDGARASVRAVGSYTLVEPTDDGASPARRYPTLAYRDGGPFLVARGRWLTSMIDAVERKVSTARDSGEHASLRRALGEVDDEKPAITWVATTVLPRAVREKVKAEMGLDEEGDDRKGGMTGVLGVASAGMGVIAGPSGAETTVLAVLRCEKAADCAQVEQLLGKKRLGWSQDFSIRLLGLGPLLDNARIENAGTSVRVSTHAPSDEAGRWLEQALETRGARRRVGPLPTTGPVTTPPPLAPDETLTPKRDASRPD
jgi:hypothetical protein